VTGTNERHDSPGDGARLRKLREWIGKSGYKSLVNGRQYIQVDDVLVEIDRLLAEPEPSQPAPPVAVPEDVRRCIDGWDHCGQCGGLLDTESWECQKCDHNWRPAVLWCEGKLPAAPAESGDVLEALAALEHEQWTEWSKTVAENERLTPERRARWESLWLHYDFLNEAQKEQDRVWARKVLAIVRRAAPADPAGEVERRHALAVDELCRERDLLDANAENLRRSVSELQKANVELRAQVASLTAKLDASTDASTTRQVCIERDTARAEIEALRKERDEAVPFMLALKERHNGYDKASREAMAPYIKEPATPKLAIDELLGEERSLIRRERDVEVDQLRDALEAERDQLRATLRGVLREVARMDAT
jgi:hypothetical protein